MWASFKVSVWAEETDVCVYVELDPGVESDGTKLLVLY